MREGNIAKYYDAQGRYKGYRDYTTGTYHDAQGRLKGRGAPRGGKSSSGGIMGFFKRMFGS